MKKFDKALMSAAVVLIVLVLTGCAGMAMGVGIASQEYVDQKFAEIQGQVEGNLDQTSQSITATNDKIDQTSSQIDRARTQIEQNTEIADNLQEALVAIQDTIQTTEELKQLAVVLEQQLIDLPEETMRKLVAILQDYLDRQE